MSLLYHVFCLVLLILRATTVAAVEVSRKVGLAWAGSPDQVTQFEQTGKVSWYYHWAEGPSFRSSDLEFVPMLWGAQDIDGWVDSINSTIANFDVKVVLGMNEPQEISQSNLTAEQGAQIWQTYIQPLKAQGLRLASPAPTNAPSGPEWLSDFMNLCGPTCTVDIIALHWYGTESTAMIQYLTDVHNMFNKPIWITEFACQDFVNLTNQCSLEKITDFMNVTVSFMESVEWVERYSWFGAATTLPGMNQLNALMAEDGTINSLGLQYIGAGNFTNGSFVPSILPGAADHQVGATALMGGLTISALILALSFTV